MLVHKNKDYQIVNIGMFNLVKGIAVIIILLEHTAYENFSFELSPLLQYIVYSTHNALIPMFLIVSGYGFRKAKIHKGIKYQFDSLMIPFFISGIATVILSFFTWTFYKEALISGIKTAVKYAGGIFFGLSFDFMFYDRLIFYGVGTVWYLLMLFWCWLLMSVLVKYVQEKWILPCIVFLMLIGWGIGEFIQLPYCILPTLIGIGYYYLGWQMKVKKILQAGLKFPYIMFIVCLAFASGFIGRFNLATCEWAYGIPDIIAAGASGFFLVWAGAHISAYEFPMKGAILWIGRNSLWFVVLHTIEDHGIPWKYFSKMLMERGFPDPLIFICLITAKFIIIAAGYWIVSTVQKKKTSE